MLCVFVFLFVLFWVCVFEYWDKGFKKRLGLNLIVVVLKVVLNGVWNLDFFVFWLVCGWFCIVCLLLLESFISCWLIVLVLNCGCWEVFNLEVEIDVNWFGWNDFCKMFSLFGLKLSFIFILGSLELGKIILFGMKFIFVDKVEFWIVFDEDICDEDWLFFWFNMFDVWEFEGFWFLVGVWLNLCIIFVYLVGLFVYFVYLLVEIKFWLMLYFVGLKLFVFV